MAIKIYSKEEILTELGKFDFFDSAGKVLLNKITYLEGHEHLDKILFGKKRNEYILNVETRPNGIEFKLSIGFKSYRFGEKSENIDFFRVEKKEKIIEKKDKSVVGRALLGGLILGPVGAIVGGISGIGNKEVKISKVDNTLSFKSKDFEKEIVFSIDDKNLNELELFLKNNFNNKIVIPSINTNNIESNFSVSDELIKLKYLLDNGIINIDEFEIQKSKILK